MKNEPKSKNCIGGWQHPAIIAPNNFQYKSLSNFSFNPCVGCLHACRFCYVPSVTTIKLKPTLTKLGVEDPDADWGTYGFVREWDEKAFLASLRRAERVPVSKLKRDGNRAIMLSSTTDPYQMFRGSEAATNREANESLKQIVRRALELIRDHSTLNVRILTRSPLAARDFDIFQTLGSRLLFGMSLPTLRNDLAKAYEPGAPAPTLRLKTLQAAKDAGIPVYVALAPTYPECDEADIETTLTAVKGLDPITVFHEPINIRAENAARIRTEARERGISLDTSVFDSRDSWERYALDQLHTAERVAGRVGLSDRLHLWPDQTFGTEKFVSKVEKPKEHRKWLRSWWDRVSAWPTEGKGGSK